MCVWWMLGVIRIEEMIMQITQVHLGNNPHTNYLYLLWPLRLYASLNGYWLGSRKEVWYDLLWSLMQLFGPFFKYINGRWILLMGGKVIMVYVCLWVIECDLKWRCRLKLRDQEEIQRRRKGCLYYLVEGCMSKTG